MSLITDISDALIARLSAPVAGADDLVVVRKRGGVDTPVPLPVEAYPSKVTETEINRLSSEGAVLVRYMGQKRQQVRRGRGRAVEDSRMLFEVLVLSRELYPASQATGVYETLSIAADHLRFFTPAGAVGMCELGEETLLSEFGEEVWQYGLLVTVPVQRWTYLPLPVADETHVREQLLTAVSDLLQIYEVFVGVGSELALIADEMPEIVFSLGDEGLSPDDDSLGATMRVATLTVKIATRDDHAPEASSLLAEVERRLFVDGIADGLIFGGLARSLTVGPVSSRYVTGGVIDYTETVATYEVAYKCKDGYAENAI